MPPNEDPLFLDNCVEGCARSHQRLLAIIDAHVEAEDIDPWLVAPSKLPGWTRAHVIAHLARNAESHQHLFAEAERGVRGERDRHVQVEDLLGVIVLVGLGHDGWGNVEGKVDGGERQHDQGEQASVRSVRDVPSVAKTAAAQRAAKAAPAAGDDGIPF